MGHKIPEHFCLFVQEQPPWNERNIVEIENTVLRESITLFRNTSNPDWMVDPKYRHLWDIFDPRIALGAPCRICQVLLPKFVERQNNHKGILRFSHSEFWKDRLPSFLQVLLANVKIKKLVLLCLEEQGPHELTLNQLWQKNEKMTLNRFLELYPHGIIEYGTAYELVKYKY